MSSDASRSDLVPEASAAGPARMDVETTQQSIREMTTLTSALFSLLQPHRAPAPETGTPAAPITPPAPAAAIVPSIAVASVPVPSIPVASIPLPSMPGPDLPSPEPELEPEEPEEPEDGEDEDEDQPSNDSRQSMALMNEIAFLDE